MSIRVDPKLDTVDINNPAVNDIVNNSIDMSIDWQMFANAYRKQEMLISANMAQIISDMWLEVAKVYGGRQL